MHFFAYHYRSVTSRKRRKNTIVNVQSGFDRAFFLLHLSRSLFTHVNRCVHKCSLFSSLACRCLYHRSQLVHQ